MTTAVTTAHRTETDTPEGDRHTRKKTSAVGYGRLGLGQVAAGMFHQQEAHITMPVERVCRTRAVHHDVPGTLDITIGENTRHDLHDLTLRTSQELAALLQVATGRLRVDVAVPHGLNPGTDIAEAAANATVNAVTSLFGYNVNRTERQVVLRSVLGQPPTGLSAGCPAVVADGKILVTVPLTQRAHVVIVNTRADDTPGPTPADGPAAGDIGDPPSAATYPELYDWLTNAPSGSTGSALVGAIEQAGLRGAVIGQGPFLVLPEPGDVAELRIGAAQQLLHALTGQPANTGGPVQNWHLTIGSLAGGGLPIRG